MVVWGLDRLGRNLKALIETVADLMKNPATPIGDVYNTLFISRTTLYRHITPKGEIRFRTSRFCRNWFRTSLCTNLRGYPNRIFCFCRSGRKKRAPESDED